MKKILALSLMLSSLALSAACTRINAGNVGIKISYAGTYRGVQDLPIRTGWVWYMPGAETVLEYPTYVKNVVWSKSPTDGSPQNEEITFTNADQMPVAIDVSLAYHLLDAKIPAFYIKFRNDDLDSFTLNFMHNVARDMFNAHGGTYHMDQIMGDNAKFIAEVRKGLGDQLEPYGVVIDQFGIVGAPRPPQGVVDAINLSVQAQRIAIQKQNELAQATADAAKVVAAAKGSADAMITRAEGEAKANALITSSINDKLLEWQRIQILYHWNGVLPSVTGAAGSIPLFNGVIK